MRIYARWTNHEIKRLGILYPSMSKERLVEEFAPHSLTVISKMAAKIGVRKYRRWAAIAENHTPVIFRGKPA